MSDGLAIRYDREGPMAVDSPADLETVLVRIAATPRFQEFPVMVELADPSGDRTLDLGVGRPYSVLVWSDWAAGEVV